MGLLIIEFPYGTIAHRKTSSDISKKKRSANKKSTSFEEAQQVIFDYLCFYNFERTS